MGEHNYNPIERHNQDIKQRYKVMRHFKSFASAEAFLDLRRIVYNFVRNPPRTQTDTGRGHQDRSRVGENRLLDLIRICSS